MTSHERGTGIAGKVGMPMVSVRRIHAEPAIEGATPSAAGEIAWLALLPDRSIAYYPNAQALVRAARRRDRRDAARADRPGRAAVFVTVITWNDIPPGFVPPPGGQVMEAQMIEIRGERVALTRGSHIRGWFVYQGGDYFEFREDSADHWQLSQSPEWDFHDPSHVVGQGATLQAAAEDFARSVTRGLDRRPNTLRETSGGDLMEAPVDLLVTVIGHATRLGYHDGRTGAALRRGNGIADALGLARWTGLQQLQLRHAYMIGRQHAVAERKRSEAASRFAMRRAARPNRQRRL